MIVIADTAPLNYLVLIEAAEVLPGLYGEVVIPDAVFQELLWHKAPVVVRRWAEAKPTWLRVEKIEPSVLKWRCPRETCPERRGHEA